MREQFSEKKLLINQIGNQELLICRNESSFVIDEDGVQKTIYEYDSYKISGVTRNELVDQIIRTDHPNSDEVKILRKTISSLISILGVDVSLFPEFEAYNQFSNAVSADLKNI